MAYINNGDSIKKKTQKVTIRHVANNLRHELNRVVQFIIAQAEEIDPNVSVRHVDMDRPASKIVAATMIFDRFIEMIAGVYHFSPISASGTASIKLLSRVEYYIWTYSLIQNKRRVARLQVDFQVPEDIHISIMPTVTEYLIAVLADNIWKYSIQGSLVSITAKIKDANFLDLQFVNFGPRIPHGVNIFEKGYQLDNESEGFGFGLYWASVLCQHYNEVTGRDTDQLELDYVQNPRDSSTSEHRFTLRNLAYEVRA